MSTIVDHQIRELARNKGLVEPFDPDLLNPASYDVTLGDTILIETSDGNFQEISIKGKEFFMAPGAFILAHTAQQVRIPVDMECVFQLKSSRGREGYGHQLAAYVDPGFHGVITLELHNSRRHAPLPLYAGLKIGQLRFMKLDLIPMRSYAQTGRYHNATSVEQSKG